MTQSVHPRVLFTRCTRRCSLPKAGRAAAELNAVAHLAGTVGEERLELLCDLLMDRL